MASGGFASRVPLPSCVGCPNSAHPVFRLVRYRKRLSDGGAFGSSSLIVSGATAVTLTGLGGGGKALIIPLSRRFRSTALTAPMASGLLTGARAARASSRSASALAVPVQVRVRPVAAAPGGPRAPRGGRYGRERRAAPRERRPAPGRRAPGRSRGSTASASDWRRRLPREHVARVAFAAAPWVAATARARGPDRSGAGAAAAKPPATAVRRKHRWGRARPRSRR